MSAGASAGEASRITSGESGAAARSVFYLRRWRWWLRQVGFAVFTLSLALHLHAVVEEPFEWSSWANLLATTGFVVLLGHPYLHGPGRPRWWVTDEGLWTARRGGRLLRAAGEIAGAADLGGYVSVQDRRGRALTLDAWDLAPEDRGSLVERLHELVDAEEVARSKAPRSSARDYYRIRSAWGEPGSLRVPALVTALVGLQEIVRGLMEGPNGRVHWLALLPFAGVLAAAWIGRLRARREVRPVLRVDDNGIWTLRGGPSPRLVLAADDVDRVLWSGASIAVGRRDGPTLHLGVRRLWKSDREDLAARIRAFAAASPETRSPSGS
jgi:hypothetical protein